MNNSLLRKISGISFAVGIIFICFGLIMMCFYVFFLHKTAHINFADAATVIASFITYLICMAGIMLFSGVISVIVSRLSRKAAQHSNASLLKVIIFISWIFQYNI